MGKGDANRTVDKVQFRFNYDEAYKIEPMRCTCDDTIQPDGNPNCCPVHQCLYCDGTGTRFNGEPCSHMPPSRRY